MDLKTEEESEVQEALDAMSSYNDQLYDLYKLENITLDEYKDILMEMGILISEVIMGIRDEYREHRRRGSDMQDGVLQES